MSDPYEYYRRELCTVEGIDEALADKLITNGIDGKADLFKADAVWLAPRLPMNEGELRELQKRARQMIYELGEEL